MLTIIIQEYLNIKPTFFLLILFTVLFPFLYAGDADANEFEVECDASSSDVSLSIDTNELVCEEKIFGGDGYESCSNYMDISAKTSCNNQLHAFIYCEAHYESTTIDSSGQTRKSNNFTNGNYDFYIESGYGHTFVELYWNPIGGIFDTVVGVKVTSLNCEITDLFD